MKIASILVPTDFSSTADTALACATQLAKCLNASLFIVHVELAPVLNAPYDDEDDPEEHRAHHLLDQVQPHDPSVKYQRFLLKGGIANEIVDFANERRVDMIIMGTHGQTNSPEAVMGAVAEAVTRRAPCLVMVVKPSAAQELFL